MSNTPQQITLGQVLEMQPGENGQRTYINDEFDAVVTLTKEMKSKAGKAFWVCHLTDPHNEGIAIETTFFQNPAKYLNKVCHFSGQGMVRESYNGAPKVGLGQKTVIQIQGNAPTPGGQQRQGILPPAQENHRPPTQLPPQAQSASFTARAVVEALSIMKTMGTIEFLEPGFAGSLHTLASDILRVHNWLEAGKLAPAAGAPPQSQAPQPEATGNRAPIDEDVPF